jgi:hypothetical protein
LDVASELVDVAKAASLRAGHQTHSLRTLQFPANVVERQGFDVVRWARTMGIETIGTRPLTAVDTEGVWDLTKAGTEDTFPYPQDYMDVCADALEHFTPPLPAGPIPTEEEIETARGCEFLQCLIRDVNQQMSEFKSVAQYEENLAQIAQIIDEKFEGLDEVSAEKVQAFFERYGGMVRANCAQATLAHVAGPQGAAKGSLQEELDRGDKLHEAALAWLLRHEDAPSTVLVGMHQPSYVEVCKRVSNSILAHQSRT